MACLLAGLLCASAQAREEGDPPSAATPAVTRPAALALPYDEREDVLTWVHANAKRNGLNPDWMLDQLAQARYQPKVAQLILPTPVGVNKNWQAYRARFIEPLRIREGVAWWREQQRWLALAETRWGVPSAIITAIVGVETHYGRVPGNFRVLDALTTLAFDFPVGRSDRRPFFREELAAYLSWCLRERRDPQSARGSYAGAMGLPQFMPSSILKYAVDFNGDGHIDLSQQGADVVGSVANYLAHFGWQPGLPTHFAVEAPQDPDQLAQLLAPDVLPSFNATQMRAHGALLDRDGQRHPGPLALVALQNGNAAPLYLATTQNFYTVTRYNWSAYYAMAVIDLAQELRKAHDAPNAAAARPYSLNKALPTMEELPNLAPQTMPRLPELAERIERLVQRHEELQSTCQALEQRVTDLTAERDSLRSRLSAARARIDALLDRLAKEAPGASE